MKIKHIVTGVCFSNQQDCHWTAHNMTTTKRKTADSTGVRIIDNHCFSVLGVVFGLSGFCHKFMMLVVWFIIPILQMGKWSPRQTCWLAQGRRWIQGNWWLTGVWGRGGSQKPHAFLETEAGNVQKGWVLGNETVTESVCFGERNV